MLIVLVDLSLENFRCDEGAEIGGLSVNLRERILGPKHPMTAFAWHNLGSLVCESGDREAGLVDHRRAVAAIEAVVGPDHPALVEPLTAWADCLDPAEADEAVELLERALLIGERDGARPIALARTRFVLGRVTWEAKRDRTRAKALIGSADATWRAEAPRGSMYHAQLLAWLRAGDRPTLNPDTFE